MAISGPLAGQRFTLKPGPNTIGRTEGDIVLTDDSQVSRKHCVIELSATAATIVDTGSTNGTYVSGARLQAGVSQPVFAGDTVQIGQSRFQLE